MPRILVFFLLFLLSFANVTAQEEDRGFLGTDDFTQGDQLFEMDEALEDSLRRANLTPETFSNYTMIGGVGYFLAGLSAVDLDEMKVFFDQEIPNSSFNMIGGGGFAYYKRFIFGGMGYGMIGQEFLLGDENNVSADVRFTLGGGGFDFGYDFSKKANQMVIPFVHVGGSGLTMNVKGNFTYEGQVITDSDPTTPAPNETEIETGNVKIGVGAAVYHIFGKVRDEDFSGIMLGVKAGVSYMGTTSEWEYGDDDIILQDGPSYNPLYYYLSINIGGGGFSVKNQKLTKEFE